MCFASIGWVSGRASWPVDRRLRKGAHGVLPPMAAWYLVHN